MCATTGRRGVRQVRRTIHLLGALPEEPVPDEVCQDLLERFRGIKKGS